MAIARTARVVGTEHLAAGTCVVELETEEPLGFAGGQYIIVDSGLVLPTGKAAKRAYSILTSDAEQHRFRLAVKRIPGGMVSAFMHGLAADAVVPFSGPWGKLGPLPDASGEAGATLVIATDTGISAALGLVQGARMRPLLSTTVLIWLQVDGDDFLPEPLVRAHLPAGLGTLRVAALPPIHHPERVPHVRALLAAQLVRMPDGVARAFFSGDGAVNYALLDDLIAAGIPATRDSVESFFNMPRKSA